MVDPPGKKMAWIWDNLGEALALLGLAVGTLTGYLRLVIASGRHAAEIIDLREILREHVGDPGQHRNPDFEARLRTLDLLIHEIRADVKTLLKHEEKKS
jgi:hypothetical protein